MKLLSSLPSILKTFLWSALVGASLALLVYLYLQQERSRAFDLAVQKEIELQQLSLETMVEFHRQMSESYFKAFIEPQAYLSRFPELLSLDERKSLSARLALSQEITPLYELLQGRGIDNVGFFSPDNRIIFRAHLPEIAGERIPQASILGELNQTLLPQHSFVVGTTTVGYKSLFPLMEGEKHIGSVELGLSFKSILRKLAATQADKELFVIFKRGERMERLLKNTRYKSFGSAFGSEWFLLEEFGEANRLGEYIEMTERLKSPNPTPILLSQELSVGQVMEDESGFLVVVATPIKEYSGEVFAQLVTIAKAPSLAVLDEYYRHLLRAVQAVLLLLVLGAVWFFHSKNQEKRRQRRWELVSSKMTEGLLLLDAQGSTTYANPKACEMLGYTKEELVGENSHELFHSHQGNRYLRGADCPILRTIKKGISYEGREMFRRKNGVLFVVSVSSYLLEECEGEKSAVVIFKDITEKVRVENLMTLQQNLSKRLEKIANNLLGFFFEYLFLDRGGESFPYVSAGSERLLGLRAHELEQNSLLFWERIEEGDRERLREIFSHAAQNLTAPHNRFRIWGVGGEYRWIEVNAAPQKEEGAVRWYGYVRDITERHLIEESLKESQQRWEFALEGSGDGIWDWGVMEDRLFLSARLQEMFGYARGEMGESMEQTSSFILKEDRARVLSTLYRFLKEGEGQYADEFRVNCKEGGYRWILSRGMVVKRNAQGEAARMIGIFTDITERKQMEEALSDFNQILGQEVEYELGKRLESEKSFRILFEKSPEGFLILDGGGNILEANPAALGMLGEEMEALQGRGVFELLQGEKIPLKEEEMNQKIERIYENRLGQEVLLETILIPAQVEGKARIFAIWRDVTEVRSLERAREREQAYLIQQSKQAELGSMIGAITHQWKQPLNVLSILIQSLELDAKEEALQKELVLKDCQKMVEMVNFMATTMEDFKNFFKPSKEKEFFLLSKAIGSVGNLVHGEFAKAGIEFKIKGELGVIAFGYSGEFKQVVLNILNNARDVFLERQIQEPRLWVEITKGSKEVVACFRDNGGGIAPELLPEKIFEPFSSTKGARGMGIGLSLSRVIIEEKMGGVLKAYNDDEGAVFEIVLPMGEAIA